MNSFRDLNNISLNVKRSPMDTCLRLCRILSVQPVWGYFQEPMPVKLLISRLKPELKVQAKKKDGNYPQDASTGQGGGIKD